MERSESASRRSIGHCSSGSEEGRMDASKRKDTGMPQFSVMNSTSQAGVICWEDIVIVVVRGSSWHMWRSGSVGVFDV
jgi:hypothetical protein